MPTLLKPVKLKTPDAAGTAPTGPPAPDNLLLETGDFILLEDGTSKIQIDNG